MPRFENPWKDNKNFVDLGHYDIYEGRNHHKTKYDLYALVDPLHDKAPIDSLWRVSLGARYSDEGSEYISGSLDFGWKYGGDKPMEECARRFVKHLLKISE